MTQLNDNVVSFPSRSAAGAAPALTDLRAYWEALRAGRQVPARSEVDPRGIERTLDQAFILERIAPGVARFRVAGMHLNDTLGMEARGMPLSSFFTPAARPEIGALLEAVFAAPCIAELDLEASGAGAAPVAARMLLLPLRSDLGDVSRVLGGFVAEDATARAHPRRFWIVQARIEEIAGVSRGRRVPQSAPGFADPAARFAPATPRTLSPDRPHLRLVHSED